MGYVGVEDGDIYVTLNSGDLGDDTFRARSNCFQYSSASGCFHSVTKSEVVLDRFSSLSKNMSKKNEL